MFKFENLGGVGMSKVEGIRWFKAQFGGLVTDAIGNGPLSLDLITSIAMQESYSDAWGLVYETLPVGDVLKRCVGDSLDYPSRSASAFPKNRAELEKLKEPNGKQAFAIARKALEELASFNKGYKRAARNPDKFCHAFGIFQYDIQFFRMNPQFFLQRRWSDFGECLALCIGELNEVVLAIYGPDKNSLSSEEAAYVAIGYNIGASRVKVGSGFKQGHRDGRTYYGENILDYLHLASVALTPIA
jgi:hypothetical protein